MAGGLASRDATLVRLDKGSGQLREIDLRGRAPGAAPALPAARPPRFRLVAGRLWPRADRHRLEHGRERRDRQDRRAARPLAADMVPCDDGAKPGDVLLKTAKSFLLPWCVKNRKTGSGAAPGKAAAPDAKQRFDDYTLRRHDRRDGGQHPPRSGRLPAGQPRADATLHRLFGRAARPARGTAGMDERRLFIIGIAPLCRCRAGPALHGPGPARGSHRHGPALLLSAGCRRPAHDRRGAICGPRLFREPAGRLRPGQRRAGRGWRLPVGAFRRRLRRRADIAFIRLAAPADLGNTANAQVAALPDGSDAVTDLVVPGFHGELAGNIAKRVAQGGGRRCATTTRAAA